MAKQAGKVIGVEIVEAAVKNAWENARRNGILNGEFFCGDAGAAALELEKRGIRPDVVVLDPPRKGCAPELVETVVRMNPQRVVYVSCDPATLARDLKLFESLSYKVQRITPVDMFPRTAHVETVVLLSKEKSTLRRFVWSSLWRTWICPVSRTMPPIVRSKNVFYSRLA